MKNYSFNTTERTIRHCPLCRCTHAATIASISYALFDDLSIAPDYCIVFCTQCGFIYNDTTSSAEDFLFYYNTNDYYCTAETTGSGGLNKAEALRYKSILQRITSHISIRQPVFMDIGCGKGGMLRWLQSWGYKNLIAVEASATCSKTIHRDLHIPVFNDISDVANTEYKADVVILSHVLEHLYSPMEFLQKINKIASEKAIFYLEVPNAESYLLSSSPWRHIYFEHINHFEAAHLMNLASFCGLRPLSFGTTAFSPETANQEECIYLICQKNTPQKTEADFTLANKVQSTLPFTNMFPEAIALLLNQKKPRLSIWGISQYVQLILGMNPELFDSLEYLIDRSTSKISRTIKGIEVVPPDALTLLSGPDVLLIPNSSFIDQMRQHLKQIRFKGQLYVI